MVWDGCSKQDSQTLQKIQNEDRTSKICIVRQTYKECEWLSLSQRRQQHKLSFMCNVDADLVPSYISDLIPPVSKISNYPLRNNRNISFPNNRTNISQKSCIPSSIRLWNGIDYDFKNLSTLTTFKKHVHSKFNKSYIPSYFTSLIYISQLIHFARASSYVIDFNTRNKLLSQKLLKQGYRHHKLSN